MNEPTTTDQAVYEVLDRENRVLQNQVDALNATIRTFQQAQQAQPPQVDMRVGAAMVDVQRYLPQLGMLATNTSMVASAVQVVGSQLIESNKTNQQVLKALERIAVALEGEKDDTEWLDA